MLFILLNAMQQFLIFTKWNHLQLHKTLLTWMFLEIQQITKINKNVKTDLWLHFVFQNNSNEVNEIGCQLIIFLIIIII